MCSGLVLMSRAVSEEEQTDDTDGAASPDEVVVRGTKVLDRPSGAINFWFSVMLVALGGGMLLNHYGLAVVAILALAMLARARFDRPRLVGAQSVRLSANREGLFSHGQQLAARHEIVSGLVLPVTPEGPTIRLIRKRLRAPIEIAVPSIEDARGLLHAMGLDARQTRVALKLPSATRGKISLRSVLAVLTATFLGSAFVAGWLALRPMWWVSAGAIVAMLLSLFVIPLLALIPTTVTLGSDGLRVRWGPRTRGVRYVDVASVDELATGVRLRLRAGGFVDITTDRTTTDVVDFLGRSSLRVHDVLIERIHQAMAGGSDEAELSLALAPRGRDGRAWLEGLRVLPRRAEGFRDVPITEEALLRAVENPLASQSTRAAAAAALSGSSGSRAPVRQRLRIAADSVVSPPLRLALVAAASDDDAALEEALDELQRAELTNNITNL